MLEFKSQFVEMFGDAFINNKGLERVEINKITKSIKSGLSRKLSDNDIGIGVIRSNNIENGKINKNDFKYWYINDPQGANTQDYILEKGDILVNFINSIAQIGKSGVYDLEDKCIYTTNLMRVKVNEKCNNIYFAYCLKTEDYWRQIRNIVQPAANQASFTISDFKKIKILLPKMDRQNHFAKIVQLIDKQKFNYPKMIKI